MTTVTKSLLVVALGAFVLTCAVPCSADLKKKEEEKGSIEKGKEKMKGWVKDGEDATKKGVQKTGEAMSVVKIHVRTGLHKAGEATSTAATKTKEALNTANDYVKDKVKQIAK